MNLLDGLDRGEVKVAVRGGVDALGQVLRRSGGCEGAAREKEEGGELHPGVSVCDPSLSLFRLLSLSLSIQRPQCLRLHRAADATQHAEEK